MVESAMKDSRVARWNVSVMTIRRFPSNLSNFHLKKVQADPQNWVSPVSANGLKYKEFIVISNPIGPHPFGLPPILNSHWLPYTMCRLPLNSPRPRP